jgi:hypothetical protein
MQLDEIQEGMRVLCPGQSTASRLCPGRGHGEDGHLGLCAV